MVPIGKESLNRQDRPPDIRRAPRATHRRLALSLFGGFLIRDGFGDTIELSGQKDRALLGFLAVTPDVPYGREKLAALLWGDSGDRQARDSLKQCLLRLRRGLAPVSPEALVTSRQSVMLNGAVVDADIGRFEELLRDGSAPALEQAVALYGGDLLDGVAVRDAAFEDWLLVERQRLRVRWAHPGMKSAGEITEHADQKQQRRRAQHQFTPHLPHLRR